MMALSRQSNCGDGSVLTLLAQSPADFSNSPHHPHSNNVSANPNQGNNSQDVINLQYLELEEFLMENAISVPNSQAGDSKVYLESVPSSHSGGLLQTQSTPHTAHHHQLQLPPHVHGDKQYQQIAPHQQALHHPHPPMQQQQQPMAHSHPISQPNHSLPDPNSPPQSNCDSPPQQLHLQNHHQEPVTSQHGQTMHNTARKSYPRRLSSSSTTSSSLVVTPPHTPQQPSPPLPGEQQQQQGGVDLSGVDDLIRKRRPVRRSKKASVPDESKDDKYWRRRAKNNEAAKRSRDLRREKENHIMQRVAFLEKENRLLHQELDSVKMENEELRERLLRYESNMQ